MTQSDIAHPRERLARALNISGYVAVVAAALGLVLGLVMVETAASDLKATVQVSGDAVDAFAETVSVVNDATTDIEESLDAAANGIGGVSATATVAAAGIEDLAVFLETDLPDDLESIRASLPAAIQAASAIDATLRALSFVGVPYSPQEPFDDSLRGVEEALAGMPDELRTQATSLRELIPAAAGLAGEADRLSLALIRLGSDVSSIQKITTSYDDTLADARVAIANTDRTLDRNIWLLRLLIVAMSVGIGAIGVGMVTASRAFAHLPVEVTTMRAIGPSTKP